MCLESYLDPKMDCLYQSSKVNCAANRQIFCSVCKTMSKCMYYLCKSGRHVICEECNNSESIKNRNDNGDKVSNHECHTSAVKKISYNFNSRSKTQNLASGDHTENVENFKITFSKAELTKSTSTPKTQSITNNVKTTIDYVNDNYNDSESSIASSNILVSKSSNKVERNCERVARPVKCPVTDCARMVTIESFFLHFNFDHSKVPRMILNKTEPQEILITYSTLSMESKCLAVLVLSKEKRSCEGIVNTLDSHRNLMVFNKDMLLSFLMAVRMPVISSNATISQVSSTRNKYTQTEYGPNKNKYFKLPINKSIFKNTNIGQDCVKELSNDKNDEVLLLWLCSLDNKERMFTITLSRIDKKQGYSYIGDAVHIGGQQDPFSIYESTKCLSIRKTAVDKLVTENELKVIVSLIQ